ncbi:carbonic anhydrase family protein [Psychrobacter sp. FBL11]|uniref:Carbonic anhydrase family protein n=1 Tax=Psychrobacter saeujeotis TaxID=3143436 RepID=A0ABU9X6Z3_9GAMM|nr:carbonic anhydrase family protein [uncultured Psychrobacter sp.]
MNHHYLATAILAVSTLGVTACTANHQASKEQHTDTSVTVVTPQDNGSVHHPKWSYEGSTGPEYWGDVEGASACKIGQQQSPIDIKEVTASSTAAPSIDYRQSTNVRIHDNGHTIVYTPTTEDNAIVLNDERYVLKQFHYHTPSEHQFGGQNYPGEIHFVHANSEGNLAVVGIMLQIGQTNDVLRVLLNGTELTTQNDEEYTANGIDLSALAPVMPTFYHYSGSLTTPPCSEEVQWYVSQKPLTLANDQFAIMSDLYEGNNRPIQPQGSRKVEQLAH